MREKVRPGISIWVFVALAGVICPGILLSASSEVTPTAKYTSVTLDQYSSTVISRYGLSLTLSLNSTTYHPGEQISVTINEKNILPVENKIHAADEWPVDGLTLRRLAVGVIVPLGYPFCRDVTMHKMLSRSVHFSFSTPMHFIVAQRYWLLFTTLFSPGVILPLSIPATAGSQTQLT